jgi:hypothetical protein
MFNLRGPQGQNPKTTCGPRTTVWETLHWPNACLFPAIWVLNKHVYIFPACHSATLCSCFLPHYANCLHMYFLSISLHTNFMCISCRLFWWPGAYRFPPILYADQVHMYILPVVLVTRCLPISTRSLCWPGAYVYTASHSGDQVLTDFHPFFMLTGCICIYSQSFWWPSAYWFPPSLYADKLLPIFPANF